ncbi:MAG: hypothetical protein GY861_06735 [bacterium]|nr:hypothetical protein [bacterium]
MSNIEPQFKGNIGMFLVCAELSKRNLIAMPTSRNTKGYDIVALNPETNISTAIQVKCTDKKDFPILNSHWRDYQQKIEGKTLCDFVFVDISNLDSPNYFIVSDTEIRGMLLSQVEEYGRQYQTKHELTWEQVLEKEKTEKRKPHLWAIKLGLIDNDKYKDKWETITNNLQIRTS